MLQAARERLTPGGAIIVSLPNVANWRVRLALLFGMFNYQASGILDRTHVRFYTDRTAQEMFRRVALRVEDRAFVFNFPPLLGRSEFLYRMLAPFNRPFYRFTGFQLVYRLRQVGSRPSP